MKALIKFLGIFAIVLSCQFLHAQSAAAAKSADAFDTTTDLKVLLEALATVEPVAFASLPKNRRGDVNSVGYWSMQNPNWPPLPCNFYSLAVWPLGDGTFVLDDRTVDYVAIDAAASLQAQLDAVASLKSTRAQMRMMSSLLSYTSGNPVYLTNLVVTSSSGMSAAFDLAGGTNNVPYDIQTTTNLLGAWHWLGIGYTSNRYTFTSQPNEMAFYRLAKPSKTMIVGWGEDADYQTEIPAGITNAIMVAGGYYQGLALLADGTTKSWGDSYYTSQPTNLTGVAMIAGGWNHNVALLTNGAVIAWGYNGAIFGWHLTDAPPDLTNATVISVQELHSLALRKDGTVVAWGFNPHGETNVPAGLSNVVAIAAGGEHNLAVKSDGSVVAWGNNGSGQTNVPPGLSNVWDVAGGFNHSVALKKDGTVICWGDNAFGQTSVPAGLSNVVAVQAGGFVNASGYTIALKKDGTLVVWGKNKIAASLAGLNQVIAIGGGFDYGFAIRTGPPTPVIILQPTNQFQVVGGTVSFSGKGQGLYGVTYQWQTNGVNLAGATNPTLTLINVQLAQQGSYLLMVNDNGGYGSLASSNASLTLITPPVFTYQSTPTNTVTIYGKHQSYAGTAIAPGTTNGFPISYHWQFNGTNLLGATTNAYEFNVSDRNAGTYTLVAQNAAGSASINWQVALTNTIDVTQDLLLIYNTNSPDSTTVLNYYLAHRPNITGANVLGLGYVNTNAQYYFETITPTDLTNQIFNPVKAWLNAHPTKHPQYVILFMDLPDRVNDYASTNNFYPNDGIHPSVSVQFQSIAPDWQPYVTHLNMGMTNTVNRTNDCIGYINKLAAIGTPISAGSPILSASAGGYANTNFVLDDIRNAYSCFSCENYSGSTAISSATNALMAAGVSTNSIFYTDGLIITNNVLVQNGATNSVNTYVAPPHASGITNVAGYASWGVHGTIPAYAAFDGTIQWHDNSGWWIINTIESHNGQQVPIQGSFVFWFVSTAFGGTNYSNVPVGAVSHTDEPFDQFNNVATYFSLWAVGKNFGICAWEARRTGRFQAVGDPLVIK